MGDNSLQKLPMQILKKMVVFDFLVNTRYKKSFCTYRKSHTVQQQIWRGPDIWGNGRVACLCCQRHDSNEAHTTRHRKTSLQPRDSSRHPDEACQFTPPPPPFPLPPPPPTHPNVIRQSPPCPIRRNRMMMIFRSDQTLIYNPAFRVQ